MSNWTVTRDELIKETLYFREIKPGLQLYVLPKTGYQKQYAVFSTRFGSIDNSFRVGGKGDIINVPDGVAHFLEHKLFEDADGDVFHRFAALGASANAYTSFTQTAYLFAATANFRQNLDLLLNFVQDPYFTEETVSKEQGIIAQEIRMYEDNPQWCLFFNLLEALYKEHPVRNDIAGTVESIAGITPEVLYNCYNTFYHPANMGLFVVGGDIDPDKVGEQVEENIRKRNYDQLGEIERFYPQEPFAVNKKRISKSMVVAEPLINIGFKGESPERLKGKEKMRHEILGDLVTSIIFAESEPLYNELYEEGLISEQFDAGFVSEKNYSYSIIGGETRDPELLYEKIMHAIEGIKKTGFTEEQIERHRRAKLGDFMSRFNSLEFIANNFLAYRFKDMDILSYPEAIKEVKVEDVNSALQEQFSVEKHAVSVIERA